MPVKQNVISSLASVDAASDRGHSAGHIFAACRCQHPSFKELIKYSQLVLRTYSVFPSSHCYAPIIHDTDIAHSVWVLNPHC